MRAALALVLLGACDPQIVLGDADSAVCLGLSCGGASTFAGSGGLAGNVAGEPGMAGSAPQAGSSTGGSPTGVAGCQPSASDESCDGLDEACQLTADDQGCSATCKGSYVQVQGTSYMACVAAADFDQAEARCRDNAMHLAKIDSAAENAAVLALALDDYVWIGGSNRDDADLYVWQDGTPFYRAGAAIDGVYQNFGSDGPSDNPDQRCVQLRQDGTWSKWQCSGKQSFVCERYE